MLLIQLLHLARGELKSSLQQVLLDEDRNLLDVGQFLDSGVVYYFFRSITKLKSYSVMQKLTFVEMDCDL
jgi:hypothetical protein